MKAIGSWSYQRLAKRRDVPTKELLLVDTNMTARFIFPFAWNIVENKVLCRQKFWKLSPHLRTKRGSRVSNHDFMCRVVEQAKTCWSRYIAAVQAEWWQEKHGILRTVFLAALDPHCQDLIAYDPKYKSSGMSNHSVRSTRRQGHLRSLTIVFP